MTFKMASGLSDSCDDYYQFVHQANEYHSLKIEVYGEIQQNCIMAFYSHPQMVNRAYEIHR